MAEINLRELAEEYYGSKHFLFLILSHNGLSEPTMVTYREFGSDVEYRLMRSEPCAVVEGGSLELPPRASRKKLAQAENRRKLYRYIPV
jgi:hypothetical protein